MAIKSALDNGTFSADWAEKNNYDSIIVYNQKGMQVVADFGRSKVGWANQHQMFVWNIAFQESIDELFNTLYRDDSAHVSDKKSIMGYAVFFPNINTIFIGKKFFIGVLSYV